MFIPCMKMLCGNEKCQQYQYLRLPPSGLEMLECHRKVVAGARETYSNQEILLVSHFKSSSTQISSPLSHIQLGQVGEVIGFWVCFLYAFSHFTSSGNLAKVLHIFYCLIRMSGSAHLNEKTSIQWELQCKYCSNDYSLTEMFPSDAIVPNC